MNENPRNPEMEQRALSADAVLRLAKQVAAEPERYMEFALAVDKLPENQRPWFHSIYANHVSTINALSHLRKWVVGDED